MPPGPKRKRGDRTYSYDGSDGSQRPSPHRPGNLSLAQQNRYQNDGLGQSNRGRGQGVNSKAVEATGGAGGSNNRRASRGGRGSSSGPGPVHTQQSTNASVASGSRGSISARGGRSAATPSTSPTSSRKSYTGPNVGAVSTTNAQNSSSVAASSSPTPKFSSNTAPAPPSSIVLTKRAEPTQTMQTQKSMSKPRVKIYVYETLTEERAASWASTGKESFINAVMEAWANGKNDERDGNGNSNDAILVLSKAFQELTRAGLDGKIAAADAGSTVKDILDEVAVREGEKDIEKNAANNSTSITSVTDTTSTPDPVSLFLDTISILTDTEHSSSALKPLMLATQIPASRMREELETPILVTIGLLRDTFARMGIRKTTNILYRQSNYNLLREETEGYSKLITEYFTTSNSGPPTGELVTETFQRILALIGAFDLDVGRVLDVTLDVFANLLVKNYRFFIKLLRASSWWPSKKSSLKNTTAAKLPGTSESRSQGQAPEGFSLDPLPQWALPGAPGWQTTDEEREKVNELKDNRDRSFWIRVREIGINAFFELGSSSSPTSTIICQDQTSFEGDEKNNKSNNVGILQDEADREWTDKTGTPPPVGNRTAAQLLGFKLRFYTSAARDPQDTLPDNLIHLAALMIKTGFISLRDLYPHLYPSDEAMETSVKERLTNEKVERDRRNRPGAGSTNALVAAGALSDDTVPPSVSRMRKVDGNGRPAVSAKTAATPGAATPTTAGAAGEPGGTAKSETGDDIVINEVGLPEPADQKIHLLKSLLLVGALPEALFILGKFPWLMDLVPDLPDYLHRILNYALSKIYEPLRPLHDRDSIRAAKKLPMDQPGASAKGELRFTDPPPRKILRWANLDRNDSGDGIDYRFYWEDWADNIPLCQNVEDVFLLCSTLLNLSGVKIGRDPDLLMKLSRIGKSSLLADSTESNLARWTGLSKRLLLPALSLTRTNPGLVNEMYGLLKFYPIRSRFNMYAEWYTGQISRMSDIKAAFDIANAETKVILKRISKTNTKPMARALAKIAYASPGVVFEVTLNQIEAYENLIEVVVECARYFTYLGYDVLTWSLMNAMGGGGRAAVENDGMMTKQWLKMLAIFAGRVFKRYSVMSPAPILQFVASQLRAGNVTGLDVLEQMINFMAGIRPDVNFNEAQIQAMAGGELLQAQTLEQLYNQRADTKMSSKRLLKALTEPALAVYMLIAVAQARQTAIFRKSETHAPPKVLGNSLDRIHRVFIQYLDMLRGNLSVKDFDESVPDVVSLIVDFKLDANAAFAISRPSISHALAEADAALKAERQERAARASAAAAVQEERKVQQAQNDHQQDQQQIDEPARPDQAPDKSVNDIRVDASSPQVKPEGVEDGSVMAVDSIDTEMKDVTPTSPIQTTSIAANAATSVPTQISWTPPLKSVAEKFRTAFPKDFEKSMSILFYATFWQLSLHDMLVPSSSYEDEIKRQRDKIATVSADRTDLSTFGIKRKEARKKELNELQDRLRTELKSQIHKYSQVRVRLQKEKDRWFVDFARRPPEDRDALHDVLLQECFLPRLLFSPLDALYTFKMIFYLHASGAPGFSTIGLLDRIFKEKQLTALIFYCTLQESESLGRFLSELLKELRRWHADPTVYEKMASGPKKDLPGFAEKLKEDGTPESFVGYEDFRRRLLRWHKNVTGAFRTCLAEGEYMHIRNAVNVLKPLPPHYPVVEWMGNNILDLLRQYEKDSREDIKVSTMSLLGEMQKRKKGWIIHAAFSTVDREKATGAVGGTNGTSSITANGGAAAATGAAPPNDSGSAVTTNAASNDTNTTEKQVAPNNIARTANLPNPINTSIKPMNAAAPDFQSQRKSSTARSIKTPTTARSEFEDGEIDDIKSGEPRSASTVAGGTSVTTTVESHKKADSGTAFAQMTVTGNAADQNSSMPAPPPKVAYSNADIDKTMPAQPDQDRGQSASNDMQLNITKPSRPAEPVRTQSGHPVPGRAVHALPQKPENSPLRHYQYSERLQDKDAEAIGNRRDGPVYHVQHDHGRNDRRSIDGRDSQSEYRKDAEVGDRLRQRTPDRNLEQGLERERRDLSWQQGRDLRDKGMERGMKPPPRDTRQNTRNAPWTNDQLDRPLLHASHTKNSLDRERNHAAAHPPGALQSISNYNNDRSPANGDRSQYMNQQKVLERHQYSKQQMNSSTYPQDRIPSHADRHDTHDREGRRDRSSRPQSPRSGGVQQNYASSGRLLEHDRRDDRSNDRDRHSQRSDHGMKQHERYDESDGYAPTGPRNEQRLDRPDFNNGGGGRSSRGRELFNSPVAPRLQQDRNHGRLSQDPNYGRLSAESDVPQGPRGRTVGRGNRNLTNSQSVTQLGQQPSESGNHNEPSPLPSMRNRQASVGNQIEQSQSQSQSQTSIPLPSPASDSSDFTGIHPSRLGQFQDSQVRDLDPLQTGSGASVSSQPGSSFHTPRQRLPPSREINDSPEPYVQNLRASSHAHPTSERRSEDKRFAGLHNVLQQGATKPSQNDSAGEHGTSILGRASRQGSFQGSNTSSTQGHNRRDGQTNHYDNESPSQPTSWQDQDQRQNTRGGQPDIRQSSDRRHGNERMTRLQGRLDRNNGKDNVDAGHGIVDNGSDQRELKRVRSDIRNHDMGRDSRSSRERSESIRSRGDNLHQRNNGLVPVGGSNDGYRRGGPRSERSQPTDPLPPPRSHQRQQPYQQQQQQPPPPPNNANWSNSRNVPSSVNPDVNNNNITNASSPRYSRDLRSRQSLNFQEKRDERGPPPPLPPSHSMSGSRGNHAGHDNGVHGHIAGGRDRRDRDSRDGWDSRDGRKRLRDGAGIVEGDSHRGRADSKRPRRSN